MLKLNRISLNSYRFVTLILILLHTSAGFAATDDIEADIQIQANRMKFDMKTGSSTYEGNVKISQGDIEISGEKVIILRQQDKIQQINIDGQPARYTQDELTENKIHATSQHMQYLVDQHRLVMTVDARLEQPDHTIESQRIVYDTENKTVIAGTEDQDQQGERVNITLTPKKDNTATTDNTENK